MVMNLIAVQSEQGQKRFRRNYLACQNCRLRKVRCDLGDPSLPNEVCARCRRERRPCVFESKKRRSTDPSMGVVAHNVSRSGLYSSDRVETVPYTSSQTADSPRHFSTMNGALQFLANAAGTVAANEKKEGPYNATSETSLDLTPAHTPRNEDKIPLNMLSLVHSYTNNGYDSYPSQTQRNRRAEPLSPPIPINTKANPQLSTAVFVNSPNGRKHIHKEPQNLIRCYSLPTSHGDLLVTSANTPIKPSVPNLPESNSLGSIHSISNLGIAERVYSENLLKNELSWHAANQRPNRATSLEDIEYIGKYGILSASEAEFFILMFFTTLHPFFPHIPKFLHEPKVLCGYPLLLCTILTIAARYHALEAVSKNPLPRNIEIHDRLWLHVQGMISRTVWAEASTRSIGTVFAFLLLTEWNPRAIHWRSSDYANKAEDLADTRDSDSLATEFPMNAGPESAGLGAMRRSYRMAWMLIGSAVRLAQDMAFMELSSCTFVATHIAEINSVMNMKRRSMLSHSLAEVDLMGNDVLVADMELLEESMYNGKSKRRSQEGVNEFHPLLFTEIQRGQIELLQIISLGHESLYGYKAQLGCLTQRQNLAILNIINPMIKNWSNKYKNYLGMSKSKTLSSISLEDVKSLDPSATQKLHSIMVNESFIFDYHYTRLYIFSLALSPSTNSNGDDKEGRIALKLDEISKSAKYIEQAFNSANEILQVAHRLHKVNMLRYMPVRWVTKIVRAVAFIVKCYLTITAHKSNESKDAAPSSSEDFDVTVLSLSLISVDQIVKSIYDAAVTLRDCSPDELHLCTNYSKILFYLYSEMKATRQRSSGYDFEGAEDAETDSKLELVPNPKDSKETKLHVGENSELSQSPKESQEFNLVLENDLMDWFINNKDMGGLDFVGPWTELIEQQLEKGGNFDFQV